VSASSDAVTSSMLVNLMGLRTSPPDTGRHPLWAQGAKAPSLHLHPGAVIFNHARGDGTAEDVAGGGWSALGDWLAEER
jgi:hypothetical protein